MSVIDLKLFNSTKDAVGDDYIGEMIDTFLDDALVQIRQMQDALAVKDVDSFRRAAHSLKSSAGAFGAVELVNLAYELEMLGRGNNLEVGNRIEVLKDAFEEVRGELLKMR